MQKNSLGALASSCKIAASLFLILCAFATQAEARSPFEILGLFPFQVYSDAEVSNQFHRKLAELEVQEVDDAERDRLRREIYGAEEQLRTYRKRVDWVRRSITDRPLPFLKPVVTLRSLDDEVIQSARQSTSPKQTVEFFLKLEQSDKRIVWHHLQAILRELPLYRSTLAKKMSATQLPWAASAAAELYSSEELEAYLRANPPRSRVEQVLAQPFDPGRLLASIEAQLTVFENKNDGIDWAHYQYWQESGLADFSSDVGNCFGGAFIGLHVGVIGGPCGMIAGAALGAVAGGIYGCCSLAHRCIKGNRGATYISFENPDYCDLRGLQGLRTLLLGKYPELMPADMSPLTCERKVSAFGQLRRLVGW